MKQQTLLLVLGAVVVLGVVLGATLTSTNVVQPSIPMVIEGGFRYLASVYTPYHYPDPYLAYVYPGEELACPIDGCQITYRLLDAFFDVRFLSTEASAAAALGAQREDAEKTLSAILPEWRTANLYNTILGSGKNGLALDTACILGYVERDNELADHVATFLTPDGNWLRDDYYVQDRWRNIADETWCIRLFAVTGRHTDRIPGLLETKINETDAFLAAQSSVQDQVAVLYHMIFLIADVDDPHYVIALDRYVMDLIDLSKLPEIQGNTFSQANILDVLSRAGNADPALLRGLADTIASRQRPDGSWTDAPGSEALPVFTTFRALLALNRYQKRAESQ